MSHSTVNIGVNGHLAKICDAVFPLVNWNGVHDRQLKDCLAMDKMQSREESALKKIDDSSGAWDCKLPSQHPTVNNEVQNTGQFEEVTSDHIL